MKTLLILRTHRADPETLAAFDRYAGLRCMDAVICCDERNGAVDFGGRPKVGFDQKVLEKLGLFQHPACGWRCGDYAYYVSRSAMPDYDFYWLVEPDVVFNTADINATFEALNAPTADFLAARFGLRDARWGWHRMMRRRYPDVYGCIFPITRLSARAIDHLHAARRRTMPKVPADVDSWPNDEVFVATELQNHGFICQELDGSLPGCYTRNSMRTDVPWDRITLAARPFDELIYHLVRRFSDWFEAQSKWVADYAIRRRGNYHVHFRAHVRKLVTLSFSTLEHAALRSAGLFPLMLVSRMTREASYVDDIEHFGSYRETEARPLRAIRTLAQRYHPRRSGWDYATACLLGESEHPRSERVPDRTDISCCDAEPLHEVPVSFALPYAYDFDQNMLFLTIHPLPSEILLTTSILAEQRRQACVGCHVAFRHLHRFYPLPAMLPLVSFLLVKDQSCRNQAIELLRRMGKRAVAELPALAQLADQSERFLRVRRQWRDAVLWVAIAPAFVTYGVSDGPVVFVVSEEIVSLRSALQALLPNVEFTYYAGTPVSGFALSAGDGSGTPHAPGFMANQHNF